MPRFAPLGMFDSGTHLLGHLLTTYMGVPVFACGPKKSAALRAGNAGVHSGAILRFARSVKG